MSSKKEYFSTELIGELGSHVLNALNAHVAILDEKGNVKAFNKQWKDFSDGIEQAWVRPLMGDNYLQALQQPLTEGNDFALRMLIGLKAVLSGEKQNFEINYPIKFGTGQYWFKASVTRLENNKGVLLVHEDVSNIVHSEKYVRETEQKFKYHFENSLYGILVTDGQNRIIEANQVASSLLGCPVHELTFCDLNEFLSINNSLHELQKIIKKQGNFLGEHEVTDVNGNIIPVELSVNLFRNEQDVPVCAWTFKDITPKKKAERKLAKSEQQYRMQFENTLEGIIIGRPDGLILEANPAACDILGYTADELAGQYRGFIMDDSDPVLLAALEERKKNGRYSGQLSFRHKEGHEIIVKINSVLFQNELDEARTILSFSDITEKIKTKRELQRAKNFKELAVTGTNLGLWEVEMETGQAWYNARWFKMLGYENEDIEYTRDFFYSLLHDEDRKIPDEELQRYIEQGDKYEAEFRLRGKDGKYHWVLAMAKFVEWNEDGEPVRLAGSHLDITERKEAGEENKKNQILLSQLFQNAPVGIVQIDKDGNVQNINSSFECIFGYSIDEIKNKPLDSFIAPEKLNKAAKSLSQYGFTGDSFQTESLRIRKDGTEVPVVIGGVPVEIDGEIISIYGMYIDISERKKLESQILDLLETEKKARIHMEEMFEEAPSAIAMFEGPEHRYKFSNRQYQLLTGKASQEIKDKPVRDILPELRDQGLIKLLDEVYATGETRQFREKPVHFNVDGKLKKYFLDSVYKPLYDENNEVYGIFLEVIDVTEQVEARQIIEQSLAEKETLLNEVHHRVKNNLAIVSGLLELETINVGDPELIKHLQSSQARISTIAKIHELLYQNESLSHVYFDDYLQNITQNNGFSLIRNKLEIFTSIELQQVDLNVNQAIPAAMLLNEIISFMLEFADLDAFKPCIDFKLREQDNTIEMYLSDKSGGLIQNLELNKKHSGCLRMELMNALKSQLQGELKHLSENELLVSFKRRETLGPHSGIMEEF